MCRIVDEWCACRTQEAEAAEVSTPDGRAWRIQGKPMARVLTGQGGFESPGRLLFAIARGCAQPVVAPITPVMTPSAIAATGPRSRRRGDCEAAPRGTRHLLDAIACAWSVPDKRGPVDHHAAGASVAMPA